MYGELLEAGGDRSGFLEPTDTALDDVAAAVLLGVEFGRPAAPLRNLVASFGNDGAHMVLAEPAADASVAVASVTRKLFGTSPRRAMRLHDPDCIKHRLGKERLVSLAGTHLDGQRQPTSVGHQMQLRAPAPAATAQRVVRRLVVGKIFFPRRRRLCGRVRSSRRYTTATSRSRPAH